MVCDGRRWLHCRKVANERYKPSPLLQGGLEIPIKVFVQWYNINGIKILQEKVGRVEYPPDGENYTDDSKEILKSLLGDDDIEEEEDEVKSGREEVGECGSGQQEENLDENENEEGGGGGGRGHCRNH